MAEEEQYEKALLLILSDIEFARRYYDYCAATAEKELRSTVQREHLTALLLRTGLSFRYFKGENFYRHTETGPWYIAIYLHFAFVLSHVEIQLYVRTDAGFVGNPFARLARETMQLTNPDFISSPPSPSPRYGNIEELSEIVRFGIEIFREVKRAIDFSKAWKELAQ